MSLTKWMNSKIQQMNWYDISLVKLATAAFILMVSKLWQNILAAEWWFYLLIGLMASIKPLARIFKKEV
jgi:hypothetical protein